jgi:hypothetical protein
MKQECVREAFTFMEAPWYIWCDMGILRDETKLPYYMSFPSKSICESVVPAGRITFLEVSTIPNAFMERWRTQVPMLHPVPSVTLGGGCIAGDRVAWSEFGTAYEATLAEFDAANIFNGKDQIVYFTMLMNRKTVAPFRLLQAQTFANGTGDRWMSMPVILGGQAPAVVDERFESD